eukprot:scaffold94822_cov25-Tisochrysis_lutea.AAC.4
MGGACSTPNGSVSNRQSAASRWKRASPNSAQHACSTRVAPMEARETMAAFSVAAAAVALASAAFEITLVAGVWTSAFGTNWLSAPAPRNEQTLATILSTG